MIDPAIALDLGETHHQAGRLAEAEAHYRAVLAVDGANPRALHLYGVLAHQVGRNDIARQALTAAIQIAPHVGLHHAALADVHRAESDMAGAERLYWTALELDPAAATAMNNLALLLGDTGRVAEAEALLHRALAIAPGLPELHNSLGYLANVAGRAADARAALDQALALRPDYPEALNNLGLAHQSLGDLDTARAAFARALAARPGFAAAANNLGNLELATNRLNEAVACFTAAADADPREVGFHLNLGSALRQRGDVEGAVSAYERALAVAPGAVGLKIKRALALAPVVPDEAAADRQWARLVDGLTTLDGHYGAIQDVQAEVAETPFFVAYQGHDDRAVLELLARRIAEASPALTAPVGLTPRAGTGGRIRIGFLSRFLRAHTIGKLYAPLIERLPRDRFEVVLLHLKGPPDAVSQRLEAAADEVVALPERLADARRAVADAGLEILFYPEIGMDQTTWLLAFARLAPVQMVGWGHPVTTGLPTIDWFVSAAGWEAPGATDRYVERVAEIVGPGLWYPRPVADPALGRAELGLPTNRRLYVCPQSLFKFHPTFDAALAALLDRDRDGLLVLLEAPEPAWNRIMAERLGRRMGAAIDRVVWLPRQPEARFIALYRAADVALDPCRFGSGNTTLEAFAVGTPVVTCPDAQVRTRLTQGFWRHMEIAEAPIADSFDGYVEMALTIARDRDRRQWYRERLAARSDRLFAQDSVIEDYAAMFQRLARP
jgi:predicted O-linked N-acetylglucosamine transferase (SPINDLY family)